MPLLKLKQQDYCKVFRVKRIYFRKRCERLINQFWGVSLAKSRDNSRVGLYTHTAQALATGWYPFLSLTQERNRLYRNLIIFISQTGSMKNKLIPYIIFGSLILTIFAKGIIKNSLVYIPFSLLIIGLLLFHLLKKRQLLLAFITNLFLIFLMISFIIIVLSKENILDIPFLKRSVG